MGRGRSKATRIAVALSCTVCGARNFKTTRSRTAVGQIELKKFCPTCNTHTLHVDSK